MHAFAIVLMVWLVGFKGITMDQHPHGGKHSRGWKELNPPEPDNDIKLVDFLLFILAGIMMAACLLILAFTR